MRTFCLILLAGALLASATAGATTEEWISRVKRGASPEDGDKNATMTKRDVLQNVGSEDVTTAACTLTIGWYMNHHCYRKLPSQKLSWPPAVVNSPCFHEDEEFACGLNGLEILDLSNNNGDMWPILAKQLVAAVRNNEKGATATASLTQDMIDAFDILSFYCITMEGAPDTERARADAIKTRLDEYNNGIAPGGPPHCDDRKKNPEPTPCVITEWSAWSECSSAHPSAYLCGDGTRTRWRTSCLTKYDPIYEDQTDPCTLPSCCTAAEWSAWSACSVVCGAGGTQRREQVTSCIDDTPTSVVNETRPCNVDVTCCSTVVGEWSACSALCDGGVRTRTNTTTCLDHATPKYDTEEEACNECACCVTSEWTAWGQCSAPCGGGQSLRYRTKTCGFGLEDQSAVETDSQSCNTAACCPSHCVTCDAQGNCLQCHANYYGPRCLPSVCTDCIPHHYGVQCQPCPEECPKTCQDGILGNGSCLIA